MKSILTNDPKILTWEEIKEKYPHQWVGLVNVEWKNMSNIDSAVVKYKKGDKNELLLLSVTGEEPNMDVSYTTPNDSFEIGSAFLS